MPTREGPNVGLLTRHKAADQDRVDLAIYKLDLALLNLDQAANNMKQQLENVKEEIHGRGASGKPPRKGR